MKVAEIDRTAVSEVDQSTSLTCPSEPPARPITSQRRQLLLRQLGRALPLGLALIVVVAVQGWNITNYPVLSDDEGTYLSQAWAVQRGKGLAHYTYWYDHPPLGWLQIALFSWIPATLLPDGPTVAYGRMIMPGVTLISATLLYVLARRMSLPQWSSVLAVLLFGLSPIAVYMHRQILLDNIAVVWMLAAFVLALSPKGAMWSHVAAGVAGATAILTKETIAIALPGLLVALWRGSHATTRKFSLMGFTCGLVLIGLLYPLYAVLKGELLHAEDKVSLLDALLFQIRDRASSGSIFTAGSEAHATVSSWILHDPVLVVGGAVAVMVALSVRRIRPVAVAGLALVLMAMRPGYLPTMYVVQALPFFALTLAGLVWLASKPLLRPPFTTAAHKISLATAIIITALTIALVVPRWGEGNHRALTASDTWQYAAAVTWIQANIKDPAACRIVVDDTIWLDLVHSGFGPGHGAIWFYKVDLDPAVRARLPGGWRDLDYIVSSPTIRRDAAALPTVSDAIAHSNVVATFGDGDTRLEIRRVEAAP